MNMEKILPYEGKRCEKHVVGPMLAGEEIEESVTDRQEKVPGFDQEAVTAAGILACGAGGLASEQLGALVRKGYGTVYLCDMDFVSPSNLSRQSFYAKDLYKDKAPSLADNLLKESVLGAEIHSLAMPYKDARAHVDWDQISVGLCNVDNNEVRVDMSIDFRRRGIPAIICGVSEDANHGYVFVQESKADTPCFGCIFPHKVDDKRHPCPGSPACKDILKVLGGFTIYALDTLLMERPRNWHLRQVFLAGFVEDAAVKVEKNPNCPLCGNGA
jgi:molybdopterin/thiamine biosynthesis adenylyltransferase